jgi:hypothetical protein
LERKPLTRTEISNLFGRHIAADQLDETLVLLCESGRLTYEDVATGGRNKRIFALKPTEETT